ncbi:tetratricopeptide repeat protein [Rhodoferax saidenbachensis]|uniref:protein O-GlcNAc transferase n=1 Tax=Rhodoferax saidenbachensis TaxID=1484693 RepID=A0ABU1ZUK4_9BURK|nr:tetratricopeptide repeat protein [Rhodoferax saidenbachensis]MDR7308530.1 putative O-linked N-acetylglucosamine transferase (SPINDLY family) [Rhodoferax saidenbachensis]
MASFEENFVDIVMRAWNGQLEFAQLIDCAAQMDAKKLSPLSAVLYQTWLSRTPSPYAYAAYFNLGVTLSNLDDFPNAEAAYRKSMELHPTFAQPRLNLGSLFERMGQIDKALAEWRWVAENISAEAPETRPMIILACNHQGRVLEARKQLHEALEWLTKSLTLDPNQEDALHHWIHLRQKQCMWPVYPEFPGISLDAMHKATSALAMLSVSDEPVRQLEAARRFVEKKVISNVPILANPRGYGHTKLRIAYVSSDFSLHPVSMLTAELFELHNRTQFEIYGYCWSPEDGSGLRQRVIQSMDQFHRIDRLTDEDAAKLIRSHEIDILIDLQGQTAGARANLLAYRPAPVQITYLGLPATTGLPSIDYVIADKFLIPEASASLYSEKPLYMPDVYQVSDRKRPVGPTPTRAACGLPSDAFVFCSLNNNYKYTPEVFSVWMNILRRTPDSVLWLLSDNPWAEANLRIEAQRRGIDPGRLYFAGRVLPPDYLARYAVADLFLDTFPFNAGTTANDALWMELPLLTYTGQSFASRMAGALLTAAKLPELITYNLQDYEEKAVALASQPKELARIRKHLAQEKTSGVLFDTPRFARNLEERLQQLVAAL